MRWKQLLAAGVAGAVAALACVAADEASAPRIDLVIRNARVFDGRSEKLIENASILIAGNRIVSVGSAVTPADARVIDAGGRVVIPGLIDAHIHPAVALGFSAIRENDPGYATLRASAESRQILMRGFTTVRDMGGPSFGLKQAIDEGVVEGPRIFPSGAIVSQTSGHGDDRPRTAPPRRLTGEVDVTERLGYSVVADGPDEVLTAVREQLRLGATQIKLTAGGGISSVYDPIDSVQFTDAELRAAVQAATDWGTYVAVHAYTPTAIRRSVEAGVRSIEHGHLIDESTMKLMAERGVFLSPQAYLFSGVFNPPLPPGSPPLTPTQASMRAKGQLVTTGLDRMMQLARKYNVKIAFGTDVFGASKVFAMESLEFGARLKWFTPVEILRQATSINGELLALSGPRNPYGKLGVIEPGAIADMLIVEGNPLEDIRVLENPAKNLRAIMKDGRFVKLDLPTP